MGLENPLQENWPLAMVLRGIKRQNGAEVKRKLPITPDLLLQIRTTLNFSLPPDVLFWAAALTAFFGLFRKSNLCPPSVKQFDPAKHFTTADLTRSVRGLALRVKYSKTIQFRERDYQVPLPFLSNHPLCPVTALLALLKVQSAGLPPKPLFAVQGQLLTQPQFVTQLKSSITKLGYQASEYSGHSFRRGRASWAFKTGLPGEAIQALGDWKSQAYLMYLDIDLSTKFHYMSQFSKDLPTTTTTNLGSWAV